MRKLYLTVIFFLITTQVLSADRSSLKYFRLSIVEIQKGLIFEESISQSGGAKGTLTRSEVRKIINHSKKSLEYSKLVKNDDLDWMDPSLFFKSLSKNYENLFREGLRLKIEAWNEGDPVIGLKANRLLNEWGSYYKKMRKKL
jgi:hypothetical protein